MLRGAQAITRTTYEYDEQGRLVEALTAAESQWTDADRGLLLALLAERRETCSECGHPMSLCRDPSTAGRWQVMENVCQATRVAQAVAEDVAQGKRRGVVLSTKLTT